MKVSVSAMALGVAACDADHKVREVGGNNKGPRIRQYLASVDPPINIAAPWCAAFVFYCAELAARTLGIRNPLDPVRQEALVQSYYDWFRPGGSVVEAKDTLPGDLVLFRFNDSVTWNHIGFVAQTPNEDGVFWTVEGNTSEENQRDGDAVVLKPRELNAGYPVCFIRWAV